MLSPVKRAYEGLSGFFRRAKAVVSIGYIARIANLENALHDRDNRIHDQGNWIHDLENAVRERDDTIRSLEKRLDLRDRMQWNPEELAFYLHEEGQEPQGPFCPTCWQRDEKLAWLVPGVDGRYQTCLICNSPVPRPSPRTSRSPRPRTWMT